MTLPSVKVTPWIATALAALLAVGLGYLTAQPGPAAYLAAPLAIAGGALLVITASKPLLLFPIVATLSLVIYAFPLLGAQVIAADLVVICILLAWVVARPRRSPGRSGLSVMVPLAALIAVCIVTVPTSQNPSFGVVKIVQRTEFLLFLAATTALLRDGAMIRRTVNAYILGCVGLAAVTLLFAALNGVQYGGINLLFYNKNSIAAFLSMALPLVAARLFSEAPSRRAPWAALALILACALITTGSRGAWVGTVIAIGVLAGVRHRAALARYVVVVGVLLVALNAVLPNDLTRSGEFNTANLAGPTATVASGGTVLTRLVVWRDALRIIAAHPILGVGVGGYISRDTYLGDTFNFNTIDPHNAVLYMWAELGTVGLIVFLWLLVSIFRVAMAARRQTRGSPDYWIAAGCLSAIASYMVFALTEPIWVRGDGLAFFLLVGIAAHLAAPAQCDAREAPAVEPCALAAIPSPLQARR